jgi:hypothetical protein
VVTGIAVFAPVQYLKNTKHIKITLNVAKKLSL